MRNTQSIFVLTGTIILSVVSLPGCSQRGERTAQLGGQPETQGSAPANSAGASANTQSPGGGESDQASQGERPKKGSLFNRLSEGEQNAANISQANANPHQEGPMTNAVTTQSGLQYEDLVVGNGPSPQPGQNVSVHYTGWLTDGKKFDSSFDRGEPFTFQIGRGQVIQGWDEGVMTMKVGGKRRLTIPSRLGYGDRGAGNLIPPGATLVFEVDLLGVQ